MDEGKTQRWIANKLSIAQDTVRCGLLKSGIKWKWEGRRGISNVVNRTQMLMKFDWNKNDYILAKTTGYNRSYFAYLRKRYDIPKGYRTNKGIDWGEEIERWAIFNMLPKSKWMGSNSRTYFYDLDDPIYGKINVKSAVYRCDGYSFGFRHHKVHLCHYYLCIGLDKKRQPEKAFLISSDNIKLPRCVLKISHSDNGKFSKYEVPLSNLYDRKDG